GKAARPPAGRCRAVRPRYPGANRPAARQIEFRRRPARLDLGPARQRPALLDRSGAHNGRAEGRGALGARPRRHAGTPSRGPAPRQIAGCVSVRLAAVLVAAGLLLAGCGSSPPSKFYVLTADPVPQRVSGAASKTVALGRVSLPGALDRPQIARRKGGNEIVFSEEERW